jgi:hypothetical protein
MEELGLSTIQLDRTLRELDSLPSNKLRTMTAMSLLVKPMKFGKSLDLEQSLEDKESLTLMLLVALGLKLMEALNKFLSVIGILGVLPSSTRLSEDQVSLDKTQLELLGTKSQDP